MDPVSQAYTLTEDDSGLVTGAISPGHRRQGEQWCAGTDFDLLRTVRFVLLFVIRTTVLFETRMNKGASTKRVILERAMEIASTVGLEGLSIGLLSKALGLSKSGLFAHFKSKERLQVEVLSAAEAYFIERVVRPAIREPRGEPRIRALFQNWLRWAQELLPGGCLFVAAATEYDDRPGAVREVLVRGQQDWIDTLTRAASIAKEHGHFGAHVDARQFAFELNALTLSVHFFHRLLHAPDSFELARRGFERLLERSRP